MSFAVKLEAAAARDVERIFEWYEKQRSGLGADFLRTIAAATQTLGRNPLQFAETRAPFRWLKLRKFPYALHYRVRGDTVLIVSCLHFRQSPDLWPGA